MKSAKKFIIFLIWVMLWQVISNLISLPLLLPNPLDTIKAIGRLFLQLLFWKSLILSFVRVIVGFLLAVVSGTLLAVLCAKFNWFNQFFSPFKSLIRSTPVSSFIILVLLWISIDYVPLFIAFLTVMPIIWQAVQQGIIETNRDLIEMSMAYSFSIRKKVRYIYIPSVLPYFYSACATGIGFAWKAGIAAEVIAKPFFSVGKNLQDAKVYLQTDELFAWTITVILLSLMLEVFLKQLINKVTFLHSGNKNAAA